MTGIICATETEMKAIINEIKNIRENNVGKIIFFEGKLNNKDIVFVQSGIGKVNAAITATLLIEKYDVDEVIFSGVAGALDKVLKIGDIVIAEDVVQHDFDTGAFGYKKGQIPQMEVWSFEGDKGLIKKVQETSDEKIKLHYGRILTGDQFIYKKEEKLDLGKEFEALCVDMESGAVAQVCYIMNVKFLIIRSISDSVTDESSMEYDKFAELAAENSKEILKKIIN